jgi:hypothetical protein
MDVCNLFNFCSLKPPTVNSSVLSAFEESSAACISDMLRQVSNGAYLDAIRMAEKFILHVEVLFGTIDDLEFHFASLNMKGWLSSVIHPLYISTSNFRHVTCPRSSYAVSENG